MSELPLTGERVIEDAYRSSPGLYAIYLMHLASYRFALQHTAGRRVLDLGCGSGYGSALIAEGAQAVVAVDVSLEAVRYAGGHHARPNLTHQLIQPGQALPFADGSFDVVLSFQVIEHVVDDAAYVAEAARVLRDGGLMIVITPNRCARLFPGQKPWNRWHLREYAAAELAALFSADRFNTVMQYMTVSERIAAIELKRYRRLKWLTLPFTLPFVPDAIRVRGLNLLHALSQTPKSTPDATPAPVEIDLEESEIVIGSRSDGALNLVVVAEKTPPPRLA